MTQQAHQGLKPEFRLLVFLVSIGFFMQGLDTTIINTALPAMAESLAVNPLSMHNVVISYVLAVATFIPLSGWLADRFGIRHVFIAAIVIFTLGSLGCGLSQNYEQLIGFRIVQGIGGALLMPVGHELNELGRLNRSIDRAYGRRLVGRIHQLALDLSDQYSNGNFGRLGQL